MKFTEKDIQDFVEYGEERGKEKTVQTVFKILSPLLTKEQAIALPKFIDNTFRCKPVDKSLYGDKTDEMCEFIANAGNDYTSKAFLLEEAIKLCDFYTGVHSDIYVRKMIRTPDNVVKFLKRNEIKSSIKELKQKLKEL